MDWWAGADTKIWKHFRCRLFSSVVAGPSWCHWFSALVTGPSWCCLFSSVVAGPSFEL